MISMLIKNSTASTIVCLCYVLFTELIMSGISNLGRFSVILQRVAAFIIKHTVYGMSVIVSSVDFTTGYMTPIIINSLIIMAISAALGVIAFRKYEL